MPSNSAKVGTKESHFDDRFPVSYDYTSGQPTFCFSGSFLVTLQMDVRLVCGFSRKSSRNAWVQTLHVRRSLVALVSNASCCASDTVPLYVRLARCLSSLRQDVSRATNWHALHRQEGTPRASLWGDSTISTRVAHVSTIESSIQGSTSLRCPRGILAKGETGTWCLHFHHGVKYVVPGSAKYRVATTVRLH